ncbi:hypothetical protein [Streptomyces mirabilis]|uniref:hypothetical protein n=1 Tax=Streptomyces mirabilis TaxID=68239 RepID=UPI00381A1CA6
MRHEQIPSSEAAAVFAAALISRAWKRTSRGLRTEVFHDGYSWTVDVPSSEQAEIVYRDGYGGWENVTAVADWTTTVGLVDAALPVVNLR